MSSPDLLIGSAPVMRRDTVLVGLVLFGFLLVPYWNVGGSLVNGGLLAIALLSLTAPLAVAAGLRQMWLYLYGAFFLTAAFYSSFIASMYGNSETTVIKLFLSVPVYMLVGYAIGWHLQRKGVAWADAFYGVLRLTLWIIVANSVVVIAEFYSPTFKSVVESFLADVAGTNYKTHLFRLRGFASAGGAALSVFHAIGVWLALKLFKARRIGTASLVVSLFSIAFSVVFIGRTAFVVIALVVGFFALENLSLKRLPLFALVALIIGVFVYIFATNIDFFLPSDVQEYSLLFFFRGTRGLEQEGTIGLLRRFLVIPESPMQLLLGIGYFSGENVLGVASDSGYIKSILAFGFPLAFAVYAAVWIFASPLITNRVSRSFVLPILLILFIVEIKEPFVFMGYTARLVYALGGLALAYSAPRIASAQAPTAAIQT